VIASKAEVPAGHGHVWDQIASSRGRVVGPFSVLLHRPELGAYIRFESMLTPVDRELAIIALARELDCQFEWAYHVIEARKAGVREDAITAIGEARLEGLTPEEALVVRYVSLLFRRHRVDQPTFDALRARLGVDGLVELTATVGYYGMLACTLNAFDVTPEAGAEVLHVP
ncbi:MAG TPA: carboxymuconolactone decarboxylase family protein, partial [Candidatus Limnocylindria bacterium]|nr:carboxymuconolactone decarboxylase family protein [Candidatus Limnocylindria bacterium]